MSMRTLFPFGLLLAISTAPIAAQEPGAPAAADVPKLIRQLGAERFEDRQAAERQLGEIVDRAQGALREAADASEDPEVRAAARRLLRRMDERSAEGGGGLRPRGVTPPAGSDDDQQPSIRSLLERFDRDLDGFGTPEGLRGLREQLERMREQLDGGFGALPFGGFGPEQIGQGTQVQIGPDGVRVEIRETREGSGADTKVYEADDIEAFREKYPEIAERVFPKGGTGLRIFEAPFGEREFPGFGPDRQLPRGGLRPRLDEPVTPPEPGERLGVRISPVDVGVAEFLEIEPGLGLVVESVEDDSLARDLGLARKDVILSIGATPIRSAADVRAALRGIAKGEEVRVRVQRFTERLEKTAMKRFDPPGR